MAGGLQGAASGVPQAETEIGWEVKHTLTIFTNSSVKSSLGNKEELNTYT